MLMRVVLVPSRASYPRPSNRACIRSSKLFVGLNRYVDWLEPLHVPTWLSDPQLPTTGWPVLRIASQSFDMFRWRTSSTSAPHAGDRPFGQLPVAWASVTPPATPGWFSCAG